MMAASISTRAAASGGLYSATVLLLLGEEDDELVHGLGRFWATLEEERREGELGCQPNLV
jgi:hypothetical protein